jgi:Fur family ferric uptake transcriptional regulator
MIDGRIPEPARITRQRMAVLDALRRAPRAPVGQGPPRGLGRSVGLATVYRALQGLVDAGRVDVFRRESGEALFRLCNPVHHHHLVCHRCDRVVEIDACGIELWASRVAHRHGFTISRSPGRIVFGCAPPARAAPETATPRAELARASLVARRSGRLGPWSWRGAGVGAAPVAAAVLEVDPGLRPRF